MILFGITILVVCAIISCWIVLHYYHKYRIEFPFKGTIGKTGLPIVPLYHNNKPYYFIIDSGADNSVLNSSKLNEFKYKQLNGNDSVYGIDGTLIESFWVGIHFKSKKYSFKEAFRVLDFNGVNTLNEEYNIDVVGVLGSSFLQRYGFLIDFNKLTLYTNGKEIEHDYQK